jgi:thiosulfate dehydrogenase
MRNAESDRGDVSDLLWVGKRPAREPDHMMYRQIAVIAVLAGGALFSAAAGAAAPPAAKVASMQQAIDQGAAIFKSDRFGSTRTWVPDMAFHSMPMTCDACHSNGGKTIGVMPTGAKIPSLIGTAADFPRYNAKAHQVFTLQRQLVHCIRAGIGGTAPAYNSPAMVDLEVYLISLSRDAKMGRNVK